MFLHGLIITHCWQDLLRFPAQFVLMKRLKVKLKKLGEVRNILSDRALWILGEPFILYWLLKHILLGFTHEMSFHYDACGYVIFSSDGSIVKRISSLAEGKEMVFSKNRGKIILVDYWIMAILWWYESIDSFWKNSGSSPGYHEWLKAHSLQRKIKNVLTACAQTILLATISSASQNC